MAKYAIFTLSMPNTSSWNGIWSGSGFRYVVARVIPKGNENIKDGDYHRYNFGDGWVAGVSVTIVDGAKEKSKSIKGSAGFCGYDWMVTSIMNNGKIISG